MQSDEIILSFTVAEETWRIHNRLLSEFDCCFHPLYPTGLKSDNSVTWDFSWMEWSSRNHTSNTSARCGKNSPCFLSDDYTWTSQLIIPLRWTRQSRQLKATPVTLFNCPGVSKTLLTPIRLFYIVEGKCFVTILIRQSKLFYYTLHSFSAVHFRGWNTNVVKLNIVKSEVKEQRWVSLKMSNCCIKLDSTGISSSW